jgi:arylsulfatase A-like enzyme
MLLAAVPLLSAVTTSSIAVAAPVAASLNRPNIVVILTDDQGYGDISFNPHHPNEVSTPNMDALAREGVFFSRAYTSGSVCAPTRTGLMLGRYQQRFGIFGGSNNEKGIDPEIPIFPSFLPEEYTSMAIGKWHLGMDVDYPDLKWHSMNRGFDECFQFMGKGDHDYYASKSEDLEYSPIYKNRVRLPASINGEYLTTRLTEAAVEFIDREKDNPFFLYLAYNAVHAPPQAPEEDIKRYQEDFPDISEDRAILMAMLDHLDRGVGSVVKKLKDEGLWENTLLFFLTDNGGSRAMKANNGILRGFKKQLFEGGIRTPWVVNWPAKFKGGRTIDVPVISIDILPTALEAIGVSMPTETPFDGKSLMPLLVGETGTHHANLYFDSGGKKGEWAIVQGDWKAHGDKEKRQLYNLAQDPSEKNDLSLKKVRRAGALFRQHKAWRKEMLEFASAGKPAAPEREMSEEGFLSVESGEKTLAHPL